MNAKSNGANLHTSRVAMESLVLLISCHHRTPLPGNLIPILLLLVID